MMRRRRSIALQPRGNITSKYRQQSLLLVHPQKKSSQSHDGMLPLLYFPDDDGKDKNNKLNLTWSTSLESHDSYSLDDDGNHYQSHGSYVSSASFTQPAPLVSPSSSLAQQAAKKIKQRRGIDIRNRQPQRPQQQGETVICEDSGSEQGQSHQHSTNAGENGGMMLPSAVLKYSTNAGENDGMMLPSAVLKYMKKCDARPYKKVANAAPASATTNKSRMESRRYHKVKALARTRKEQKEAKVIMKNQKEEEERCRRRQKEEEERFQQQEERQLQALARARKMQNDKKKARVLRVQERKEKEEKRLRLKEARKNQRRRLAAKLNGSVSSDSGDSNQGSNQGSHLEETVAGEEVTAQQDDDLQQQHTSAASGHGKSFMHFVEHLLIEKAVSSGFVISVENSPVNSPLTLRKEYSPNPPWDCSDWPAVAPTTVVAASETTEVSQHGGNVNHKDAKEDNEGNQDNHTKFLGGPDLPKPVLRRFPSDATTNQHQALFDTATDDECMDEEEEEEESNGVGRVALHHNSRNGFDNLHRCIGAKFEEDLAAYRRQARILAVERETMKRKLREGKTGGEEEEGEVRAIDETPSEVDF